MQNMHDTKHNHAAAAGDDDHHHTVHYYPSIQLERLRKYMNLSQGNRNASHFTPEQKHSVLLQLHQSVHHLLFNFTETICQFLQSL
jgi:hypothetical protein